MVSVIYILFMNFLELRLVIVVAGSHMVAVLGKEMKAILMVRAHNQLVSLPFIVYQGASTKKQ